MEITRLSPDDEVGCADAVALLSAAAKVDCPESLLPTPRSYAAHLKYGWDGDPGQAYLARDEDGVAVGLLGLHTPTYDNTHLAWLEVRSIRTTAVAASARSWSRTASGWPASSGRTSIGTDNWDLPKANAFSLRHGFEQKAIEVNRRQDIAGLDWSVVQRLYDEAVQASTGVRTGAGDRAGARGTARRHGRTDRVDQRCAEGRPGHRGRRVHARSGCARTKRLRPPHDRTIYRVIARERSTGELAGHSTIAVERERPHIAEQHDTAVDRAHRGHRLGALVKTAMLLWMREQEPAVTQLDTWNAESNAHMIAINEQLNYRIVARAIAYQKSL